MSQLLRSIHFQRPEARLATKRTVDHHDDHIVTVTEHHNDRVDVDVSGPSSRLLVPAGYCDHRGRARVVRPQDGDYRDESLGRYLRNLRGEDGAVTASGLFALPWVQSETAGTPVFNLASTHLRCAMFTNSITPNFDDTVVHCGYAGAGGQYAANEVTGTGYSAGGAGDSSASGTFSSPTFVNTSGVVAFNASNAVWTASTITSARCALIYDNSLSGKTAFVLVTFGGDYSTSSGTFTIQWNASGIWTWTVHS